MHQMTWPLHKGSKIITYLEMLTPICLFTIQLLCGYDDEGRLLRASLTLKLFLSENLSRRNEAQKWRFWDPQKAHPCAKPRRLMYCASKSAYRSWRRCSQNPKNLPSQFWLIGAQNHACAETKPLYIESEVVRGNPRSSATKPFHRAHMDYLTLIKLCVYPVLFSSYCELFVESCRF